MNAVVKPRLAYTEAYPDAWHDLATSLEPLRSYPAELSVLAERSVVTPPIIIVGAGPAAQECARYLSFAMSQSDWLLMINGEKYLPYNRAQLSTILASDKPIDTLLARDCSTHAHVIHGVNVAAVQPTQKLVITDDGTEFYYHKLVLATGSSSRRPPLPGLHGERVFDFRQLYDLEKIAALAPQRIAVLGGGLLGIEAARAVQRYSSQVTIFERFSHLLPRQMDADAGAYLMDHLTAAGIQIYTDAHLLSAEVSNDQIILREESGVTWEFDAVVCATGISANTGLAQQAGLHCRNGIVVDDDLKTSDPDIYAIGECSERQGVTATNLSSSLDHARRAASAILNMAAPQQPGAEVFQLKINSCVAVAIGVNRPKEQGVLPIVFAPDKRTYYRIIVDQQQVVGAILIGDAGLDFSPFSTAVEQKLLWSAAIEDIFLRTGQLPHIDSQSDNTVTCFCTGTTVGQLRRLHDSGLSHEKIISQTGVSQHCGSCVHRVAKLMAVDGPAPNTKQNPAGLWTATLLAVLLIIAVSTALTLPFANSWHSPWRMIDVLWRNGVIRQVSGYLLLSLLLLAFWPAWQRRSQRQDKQRQKLSLLSWHLIAVCIVVAGFVAHTGMRLGHGLDASLNLIFITALVLGALSSVTWRQAAKSSQHRTIAMSVRALHWAALFPLPAVVVFHLVKAYYF